MTAMKTRLLMLLAVVAGAAACLAAQDAGQSPPAAVSGFVRYAGGTTIEDVRVTLLVPGSRDARTTRTAVDGSYRFDDVPAGDYQVSVSHPGGVARQIKVTPGTASNAIDFSIPDGSERRVVTGRLVMNTASAGRQVPTRIGIAVIRADGTFLLPLASGDQWLAVRLPDNYYLDTATYGAAMVYSVESVGGRRLTSGAFSITVPPEPRSIPELVITVGVFR
jgi:hypothetical protein